eukprot:sb/3474436/
MPVEYCNIGSPTNQGGGVMGVIKSFFNREFFAELLSTFLLVLIGNGAVAQYKLLGNEPFLSINIGYGLAVLLGVLVAGEASGAHMNPAVTIGLASFCRFDWRKIPKYLTAQFLGGFLSAFVLFLVYYGELSVVSRVF